MCVRDSFTSYVTHTYMVRDAYTQRESAMSRTHAALAVVASAVTYTHSHSHIHTHTHTQTHTRAQKALSRTLATLAVEGIYSDTHTLTLTCTRNGNATNPCCSCCQGHLQ